MHLTIDEFVSSWIYKQKRKNKWNYPSIYYYGDSKKVIDLYTNDLGIHEDEKIYLVYENNLGSRTEMLVFTSLGLHIYSDTGYWGFTGYNEIEKVTLPENVPKLEIFSLDIILKGEKTISLPVKGKQGKYLDSFTILDFFRRILRTFQA